MRFEPFRYMAWAKAHNGRGRFPLHMSGMPAATLEDLGVPREAVALQRPIGTGPDPDLVAAVAARYRVPGECVLPACGTHHANFLVAAALLEPGDAVLVESPTYEAIPGLFRLLGAEVRWFRRRREDAWRLPVDEVRDGLRAGARLVAVTDLHNPTGARLLPDELAALEGACAEFGGKVLVDEVYRDFLPPPLGTAFTPGGPFLATTSLTKVYGLGALRMGWAILPPDLRERAREVNEFVVVNLPAPSASVALAAWAGLEARAARAREVAARNLRVLAAWVRGRGDVLWSPPDAGISAFLEVPALRGKDDLAWVERLLEETGVAVVPGTMFDAPGCLRVSFGIDTDPFREGLARFGEFLDRTR